MKIVARKNKSFCATYIGCAFIPVSWAHAYKEPKIQIWTKNQNNLLEIFYLLPISVLMIITSERGPSPTAVEDDTLISYIVYGSRLVIVYEHDNVLMSQLVG